MQPRPSPARVGYPRQRGLIGRVRLFDPTIVALTRADTLVIQRRPEMIDHRHAILTDLLCCRFDYFFAGTAAGVVVVSISSAALGCRGTGGATKAEEWL